MNGASANREHKGSKGVLRLWGKTREQVVGRTRI